MRIAAAGTKLVALFLLTALIGACSSPGGGSTTVEPESPPTSGSAVASSTPAESPENEVIKVGAWVAQSGPLASVSATSDGASAYFEKVNDDGGVNGYEFSYTVIDDGADPTRTVTAIRDLWETDEVFAIVAPYGSTSSAAVADYIRENSIPVIAPFADATIFLSEEEPAPDTVFGFYPPYQTFIAQLLDFAYEQGVRSLVVAHTTDAFGEVGARDGVPTAEALGMEVLDVVAVNAGESNFAPIGRRIASAGADAVLLWGIVGGPQVVTAAEDSGFEGLWLFNTGFEGGSFLDQMIAIPSIHGRTYMNIFRKLPSAEGLEEFNERFSAKESIGPDVWGAYGWTAAAIFVEAVRRATSDGSELTWQGVSDALETFDNVDIEAGVGITYSPDQHYGSLRGAITELTAEGWSPVTDFELLPGLEQYAGE